MPVHTQYFPFGGGLDVATPAVTVNPGRLISCLNFEPDIEGGYRFVKGYERFDGSPRPHAQGFLGFSVRPLSGARPLMSDPDYLANLYDVRFRRVQTRLAMITNNVGTSVGLAHIAGFSDHEGNCVPDDVEINADTDYRVAVFRLTGTLQEGHVINGSWVVDSTPVRLEAPTREAERRWLLNTRNAYRQSIRPLPGSGSVRGIWHIGDRTYAWRDNQAGNAVLTYKSNTQSRRETELADGVTLSVGATGLQFYDETGEDMLSAVNQFHRVQFLELPRVSDVHNNVAIGDSILLTGTSSSNEDNTLEYVVETLPEVVSGRTRIGVSVLFAEFGGAVEDDWVVRVEHSKDTATRLPGWEIVTTGVYKTLKFRAGKKNDMPWPVGESVSITGMTGMVTIVRVIDWAGGYSTDDASGYLVVQGGAINSAAQENFVINVNGGKDGDISDKATAVGVWQEFSIPAGVQDRMRIDQYNFYAQSGGQRIYACAGGRAFEIDENENFTPIVFPTARDITGNAADPDTLDLGRCLIPVAHNDRLFIAIEGGLLWGSVAGDPLNFSSVLDAFEIGLGNEITGLESIVGGALVISTEREIKALFGRNVADFELRTVSEKQGVHLDSVRKIDDVYGLSWAGVVGMTRAEQFGDFISDTVSNAVAPLLRNLSPSFSCASVVKSRNLYRLHFSDTDSTLELGRFRLTTVQANLTDTTLVVAPITQGSGTVTLAYTETLRRAHESGIVDTYESALSSTRIESKGGVLAIRYRGVEHQYRIGFVQLSAGQTRLILIVHSIATADAHFLSGQLSLDYVDVAIRQPFQPQTENISMYVPEPNSPGQQRNTQTREGVEFGRYTYPTQVNAVWECAEPDGERIFFSGSDGFVYEDRVGSSFDGQEIEGFIRTPFIHFGMPTIVKRYRQIDMELTSSSELNFRMVMDLDYGSVDSLSLLREDERVIGEGNFWDDTIRWESFFWDGVAVNHAVVDLVGSGINASFLFVFKGDFIEELVLQGALIQYSRRRQER